MSGRGWTGYLRSGTALGLLMIATAQASAGGFGIREQSAYGQGTSFAGIAAGGALSSMFWNPATMTQVPGIQSETAVTGHPSLSSNTPAQEARCRARAFGWHVRYVADGAFVPASYLVLSAQSEPLARRVGQCAVRPLGELPRQIGPAAIMPQATPFAHI